MGLTKLHDVEDARDGATCPPMLDLGLCGGSISMGDGRVDL